MNTALVEKIRLRKARVGVIGLGYVGLPLAVEFAKAGFQTVAFDIDTDRVDQIRRGNSYIGDVSREEVRSVNDSGRLQATNDFSELSTVETITICVPTPLRKTGDPDLSYVVSAVDEIARRLNPGQLVVLESTTYPGTVEEVVRPRLESTGLKAGQDFYLAFSPERVDPGNTKWNTRNIPKVVGGIDDLSTEVAVLLYEQIVDSVVAVSSTTVAEMVKLLENTFRAVNIGLANELALMCRRLGVDVWEVIDAAKTKPFGFMPFYPGPGLGGHCIPIDPFYLSWKAKQTGFESRFIELAGHINAGMPRYVVERVSDALNSKGLAIKGSHIHLFGVAYKAGVGDMRASPAVDVALLLQERGAVLSYSDPLVPKLEEKAIVLNTVDPELVFENGIDCAVITTDHPGINYEEIARRVPVVVDTRNALKDVNRDNIFRL